jgi:hypothetical protein
LGFIPTARIGAGAWRKQANTRQSGDTDQVKTPLHGAKKEHRNGRKKEKKLLRRKKQKDDPRETKRPPSKSGTHRSRARLRFTPLHSVALRASTVIERKEKKPDGKSSTLLTTLIGAAAHRRLLFRRVG